MHTNTDALLQVLPDYKPISQAPRSADEPGRLYKSIDDLGNVFLIANPATWKYDEASRTYYRPEPQAMGSISKLSKGGQKQGKQPEGLPW